MRKHIAALTLALAMFALSGCASSNAVSDAEETPVGVAVQVETIEDPLMRKVRWLDKLVDELAEDGPLEKMLR